MDNNTPSKEPWLMEWVQKQTRSIVDSFNQKVEQTKKLKMPWEMDWTRRGSGRTPEPQKPATAPSEPLQTPSQPVEAPKQDSSFNIEPYMDKLIQAESSGRATVKAKTSSAVGHAQFTEGTWIEQVAKQGYDYTLSDRKDPVKTRNVLRGFTQENYGRAVRDLGREPTPGELYMYHFLPYGAKKMLKAEPDTPAASLYSKRITEANKPIFYTRTGRTRTVKEVKQIFERKMGNG